MHPFEEWVLQNPAAPEEPEPEELMKDYPCCVCGEWTEILCDPEEFDPDNHYCGRSPRCCP